MDFITLALSKKFTLEAVKNIAQSTQGKSAYEVALDNGFSGTEEEWLKSLQGITPNIGENNNWFIGEVDTGILAVPNLEDYFLKADLIALSEEEILEICK